MKPLHELGVAELGRALAAKEVSSVEITTHLLARMAAHAELGAVLCIDEDTALQQARVTDARRAGGSNGALLARLELEPAQADAMLTQLNGFFRVVEQMSAVDTSGVEPLYTPLSAVQEVTLRLRDDVVTETDQRALNQRSAPAVEDGLYLVPQVVGA